jgi:serine protease
MLRDWSDPCPWIGRPELNERFFACGVEIMREIPTSVIYVFVAAFLSTAARADERDRERAIEYMLDNNGVARVIVSLTKNSQTAYESAEQVVRLDGIKQSAGIDKTTATAVLKNRSDFENLKNDPRIISIIPDQLLNSKHDTAMEIAGITAVIRDVGLDGRGAAIAFIDNGIDDEHPSIKGRVVLEGCFSVDNSGGMGSCGGAANRLETGEVVDISAHAATCRTELLRDDLSSPCAHGTSVAGIAAGRGETKNNAQVGVGVASAAQIVAAQVFSPEGGAFQSSVLRALTWIAGVVEAQQSTGVGPNIVALNMSFGLGLYQASCDPEYEGFARRIDQLYSDGVASFAAAGNEAADGVSFPGCISNVIAVSAMNSARELSAYANRSPKLVRLLAPGDKIISPVLNGRYTELSGTSMASATAAGAYTLLKNAFPKVSVDTIIYALRRTGPQIKLSQSGAMIPGLDLESAYRYLVQGLRKN